MFFFFVVILLIGAVNCKWLTCGLKPAPLTETSCVVKKTKCSVISAASQCVEQPKCGWCPFYQMCMDGTSDGPEFPASCPGDPVNGVWEFKMACSQFSRLTDGCTRCVSQPGCGFCPHTGSCMPELVAGVAPLPCPANLLVGGWQTGGVCCPSLFQCSECVHQSVCGWCPYTGRCLRGDNKGPLNPQLHGQCQVTDYGGQWLFDQCCGPSFLQNSIDQHVSPCQACTEMPGCGYCGDPAGTANPRCWRMTNSSNGSGGGQPPQPLNCSAPWHWVDKGPKFCPSPSQSESLVSAETSAPAPPPAAAAAADVTNATYMTCLHRELSQRLVDVTGGRSWVFAPNPLYQVYLDFWINRGQKTRNVPFSFSSRPALLPDDVRDLVDANYHVAGNGAFARRGSTPLSSAYYMFVNDINPMNGTLDDELTRLSRASSGLFNRQRLDCWLAWRQYNETAGPGSPPFPGPPYMNSSASCSSPCCVDWRQRQRLSDQITAKLMSLYDHSPIKQVQAAQRLLNQRLLLGAPPSTRPTTIFYRWDGQQTPSGFLFSASMDPDQWMAANQQGQFNRSVSLVLNETVCPQVPSPDGSGEPWSLTFSMSSISLVDVSICAPGGGGGGGGDSDSTACWLNRTFIRNFQRGPFISHRPADFFDPQTGLLTNTVDKLMLIGNFSLHYQTETVSLNVAAVNAAQPTLFGMFLNKIL